jgi:acyl-CoA thioesterase FadM
MNLWLRLFRVLLTSFFRPRLGFLEEGALRFRVSPLDLDVNLHMTNSRYLALMDLGRLDMIARSGLWRPMLRGRWSPVIAASQLRFRRPLAPFRPILLRTRLLTWDEKWLYIEHRIEAGGELACHAVVRAAFVRARKVVPPEEIAVSVGFDAAPPPAPGWLDAWRELDRFSECLSVSTG